MKEYVGQLTKDEDNAPYIDKKFKDAKIEERTLQNSLLDMQEISNAPWKPPNTGLTRADYVNALKAQEILQEKNDIEPSKANLTEEELKDALKKQAEDF